MEKGSDTSEKSSNGLDKQNNLPEVGSNMKEIRKRLTCLEWICGILAGVLLLVLILYIFHQEVVEKIYRETEYDMADRVVFMKDILIIGVLTCLILFFLYQFMVYTRLKNRYSHSDYVLSLIKFARNLESSQNIDKGRNSSVIPETFAQENRKCVWAVNLDRLIETEMSFLKRERKRDWLLKMLES